MTDIQNGNGATQETTMLSLGRMAITLGLLFCASGGALADTYKSATFTGAINGGNANVKAPFSGNGFNQGDTISGSFVFDVQEVPASGSGFTNVFFSSFPDIGAIPNGTAFSLTLDSLSFDLGSAQTQFPTQEAAIQYNNGHFNGFFYISDFTFMGSPFELQIQGGSFDVVPIVGGNPTFTHLINGHINVGDANLANIVDFTPGGATQVPEPASLTLLVAGLIGLGVIRRKARAAVRPL